MYAARRLEEILMRQGYTHICVVLDASGSMHSMTDEVKGALRGFADDQRKES